MLDLILSGGSVLDGTGQPARRADVGIRQGRVAAVGDLSGESAGRTLAVEGRTVCPGFIDIHSHDDFNLPVNPVGAGKLRQGVTTAVTGNCGFSPAPVVPGALETLREAASFLDSGISYDWESFAEFLAAFPATGPNVVPLVGHVAVRCAVLGGSDRPPQAGELARMAQLVDEAMAAGAFGFSTGLIYPPACYADLEELVALATAAARRGGGYFTHQRDEGAGIAESLREATEIGRRSGAHVQIAHLKLMNRPNWGRAEAVLAQLAEARAQGVRVHCDQYPYDASSTGLKVLLPAWCHEGGGAALAERLADGPSRARIRADLLAAYDEGTLRVTRWEDALVSDSPTRPETAGRNLAEIAANEGREPVDVLLDLLTMDRARTLGIFFSIGEADLRRFMADPNLAVGSDGIFLGRPGEASAARPHPRYFGTFPRVLGHYAREEGVLALPEAVRKMTGLPAEILGLSGRGRIAPGCVADLVVFDADTVRDRATYTEPEAPPAGIETVLVAGVTVVEAGRETGATPGRVLRRGETG